jgi:hypothetical protein
MIKEDIEGQVGQVKTELDEFKEAPVDADTFGGKTPDEWDQKYDQRYVQRAELPSGWGQYKRYFKQLNSNLPAIIKHNLHRYPLVNIFELAKLEHKKEDNTSVIVTDVDGNEVKFLVYYAGHRDPVAENLMTRGADNVHWGDPLTLIMEQFGMAATPTQLFDDVLNDLWGKMFDPGLDQDHFSRASYGHSKYIQKQVLDKNRTVEDLRSAGMWEDLRMAMRPRAIPVGTRVLSNGESISPAVQTLHLSQDMLEIQIPSVLGSMDLMVLLRT